MQARTLAPSCLVVACLIWFANIEAYAQASPRQVVVQFKDDATDEDIRNVVNLDEVRSATKNSHLGVHILELKEGTNAEVFSRSLARDHRIKAAAPTRNANLDIFAPIDPAQAPQEVRSNVNRLRLPGSVVSLSQVLPASIAGDIFKHGTESSLGLFGAPPIIELKLSPTMRIVGRGRTGRIASGTEELVTWFAAVELITSSPTGDRFVPAIAQFFVGTGQTWGRIDTRTDSFAVVPVSANHQVMVRLDSREFPPDHPPQIGFASQPSGVPQISDTGLYSCKTNSKGATQEVELTVGIVFTAAAFLPFSNYVFDRPCGFAYTILGNINASLTNSKVGINFRLVGSGLLKGYAEPISNNLRSIAGVLPQVLSTADGVGKAIHQWRKKAKANIVIVVVNSEDGCGLSDERIERYDDETRAIVVVDSRCAALIHSAAHEIGHVMGLRHDVNADANSKPFTFGHGYIHRGAQYKFMTIMGTRFTCPDCGRINYWSNPDVREPTEGRVTGDRGSAHEAQVLLEVAPITAKFFR